MGTNSASRGRSDALPSTTSRASTPVMAMSQRQIYATFQEDCVALSLTPFFGDGHLLWASDYPHPDSVWPNSRDTIERQMRSLTPEMRRALTHGNAAALYGLALAASASRGSGNNTACPTSSPTQAG